MSGEAGGLFLLVTIPALNEEKTVLGTQEDGYRGGCEGPVETVVSTFVEGQPAFPVAPSFFGAVAVDIAVAPAGDVLAIVVAGNQQVHVVPTTTLEREDTGDGCQGAFPPDNAREPPLAVRKAVARHLATHRLALLGH